MEQAPPPPETGELQPNWPPWFGVVGFVGALVCTVIAVVIVLAVAGVAQDEETPVVTVVATLIQAIFFIGAALVLARSIAPPRPWHFGLRRGPLWRTIGWAALGMLAFYVFAAVYTAILDPQADQDVTESLGAGDGTLGLIAAGVMVIVVAPFAEELFFRGFFYRALRTRWPVLVAALIDGAIFGLIHFGGADGADALLILPPLAVLGVVFCLVYEKTKSLWAVIGMHAFNNAIAFSAQLVDEEGWKVAVVLGPLMLIACVVLPAVLRDGPSPLPPVTGRVGPEAQLSLPLQ